jgi:hypothetical protein
MEYFGFFTAGCKALWRAAIKSWDGFVIRPEVPHFQILREPDGLQIRPTNSPAPKTVLDSPTAQTYT